jgi:hypothetical protein
VYHVYSRTYSVAAESVAAGQPVLLLQISRYYATGSAFATGQLILLPKVCRSCCYRSACPVATCQPILWTEKAEYPRELLVGS